MHTHTSLSSHTCFFFFNDTATTEIYTLSLHDALPICRAPARSSAGEPGPARRRRAGRCHPRPARPRRARESARPGRRARSEEHTSELQSQFHLVCRLLLEKKKNRSKLDSIQKITCCVM